MRPEENNPSMPEENDFPLLDMDELDDDIGFTGDEEVDPIETKPIREKSHIVRRNIEAILAERELQRQLSDVFDEDILLD